MADSFSEFLCAAGVEDSSDEECGDNKTNTRIRQSAVQPQTIISKVPVWEGNKDETSVLSRGPTKPQNGLPQISAIFPKIDHGANATARGNFPHLANFWKKRRSQEELVVIDQQHSSTTMIKEISLEQESPQQPLEEMRTAVMSGNVAKIQSWLVSGGDVNAKLQSGWSLLMYAALCTQLDILYILLQHKADPNTNADGYTALMICCGSRHNNQDTLLACMELLLNSGASPHKTDRQGMSALLFVAREGSEKLLQRLLEYGVNLNQADCKGWTALFWAASRGHVSAVSILISAGADANHTDHVGSSLHAVILQEGHHKILSLLAPQSAMESNVPRRPQRTPNALQDGAARIRIKQGRTSVRRVTEKSAPQLVSFILKQLQENDLHDFLSGLQLAHLTLYFQAHRVSFHSLLSMTAQDLAKIGVLKMGEQQKILWAVENVHRKGWDPNCLPCKCTSFEEAVTLLVNADRHCRYIEAYVTHLRKKLEQESLHPSKVLVDYKPAEVMLHQTRELENTLQSLHQQVCNLVQLLDSNGDKKERLPPDFIPLKKERGMKPLLWLLGGLATSCLLARHFIRAST